MTEFNAPGLNMRTDDITIILSVLCQIGEIVSLVNIKSE